MCVVSPFWGPPIPHAVDRKENAPSSIVWVEGRIARAPGLHGKIAKVCARSQAGDGQPQIYLRGVTDRLALLHSSFSTRYPDRSYGTHSEDGFTRIGDAQAARPFKGTMAGLP